MDNKYETLRLNYTIHKYSSYSGNYVPENILLNNPADQLSRWFTDSTTPSQFIMLKLHSVSIVETILFGKYIKPHVSDLKKFQVFGGTDENNLSLLLTAGLKKDCIPERFKLRHRTSEGLYLPVKYIKIVPLQSWGPAYNYTIWYVKLEGKNKEPLINSALDTINLVSTTGDESDVSDYELLKKIKYDEHDMSHESVEYLQSEFEDQL